MSNKSLRADDFLEHFLKAIERIEGYTLDKDLAAFVHDEQLQDAVIRNIEILGEAANNVKKSDPLLPTPKMSGRYVKSVPRLGRVVPYYPPR